MFYLINLFQETLLVNSFPLHNVNKLQTVKNTETLKVNLIITYHVYR